jgi:hypothetical protein
VAYHPHQHPIEDILNLSTSTKGALKGGDINYATLIRNGVFSSNQIPFDAILTDGENILVDHSGNVLWAYTPAIGRVNNNRIASIISMASTTPVPNTILWQGGYAFIQDMDFTYYYRFWIEDVDNVPTIILSDETFDALVGGESPYVGDLIVAEGVPYLRNLSRGLYHEIYIEEVGGIATIMISDQTYDIYIGSGSITTGNIALESGNAYLKNITDTNYREVFAQRVDGVPTIQVSDSVFLGV